MLALLLSSALALANAEPDIMAANVNGVVGWVEDRGGLDTLAEHRPDVLVLQELRVAAEDIPEELKEMEAYPYQSWYAEEESGGCCGMGVMSKYPINTTEGTGDPQVDEEARVQTIYLEDFDITIYSFLLPQTQEEDDDSKAPAFLAATEAMLREADKKEEKYLLAVSIHLEEGGVRMVREYSKAFKLALKEAMEEDVGGEDDDDSEYGDFAVYEQTRGKYRIEPGEVVKAEGRDEL